MSIVILVGGRSEQGNAEHRYLVSRFLDQFDSQVSRIITVRPQPRPWPDRLRRLIKRGHYSERLARACYGGGYGPDAQQVQQLLLPHEDDSRMPGGSRVSVVSSHNNDQCRTLISAAAPRVIVVYGTAIIRQSVASLARDITLNMHTGLSPFYRGDSTLFWPVHYNDPDHLGVTVHTLTDSVDGGDIAATGTLRYEAGDTEAHLFAKGVRLGTELYLDAVDKALDGTLRCTPQDTSQGKEFSWQHRTVAAERQFASQLARWNALAQMEQQ